MPFICFLSESLTGLDRLLISIPDASTSSIRRERFAPEQTLILCCMTKRKGKFWLLGFWGGWFGNCKGYGEMRPGIKIGQEIAIMVISLFI